MIFSIYIDIRLLQFGQFILSLLGIINFLLVCFKRHELFSWLLAYLSLTIGLAFTPFALTNEILQLLSNFFYLLSVILIVIAILIEYIKTFKKQVNHPKIRDKFVIAASAIFIIVIEVFMR